MGFNSAFKGLKEGGGKKDYFL